MTDKRNGDLKTYTQFRPSRFFKATGKWYFQTREGVMEGPFERRLDAENRLQTYVSIFKDLQFPATISNPGFYASPANGSAIEPIQMRWR